jgi:WD40 repeat protein
MDFQPDTKLIAGSVANLIGIQDYHSTSHPRSLFTLKSHSGRVNAVKWLSKTLLVSVSDDQSFAVWTYSGDPCNHQNWRILSKVEGAHSKSINYLTVLSISEHELYFATMCMGGTLKLWTMTPNSQEVN